MNYILLQVLLVNNFLSYFICHSHALNWKKFVQRVHNLFRYFHNSTCVLVKHLRLFVKGER